MASVPLVDREGRTILRADGSQIMLPADFPPEFFVRQGWNALNQRFEDIASLLVIDLWKFRQNGSWDVQRRNRVYHHEWVDYATIAIGLYGGAAGIPEKWLLSLQNTYALRYSDFGNVQMDETYPHLARRNVMNTRLGYELYRTGRIAPAGDSR